MPDQLNLFGAATSKLNLKRPLAFFDIESTGVDFAKDRIVEISILLLNPDGSKSSKTIRINPTIPIPIEASKIHGIYDEDIITCPTFKEAAKEIFDLMDPADLAGFNSNRFDVPMLMEEFIRAGFSFSIDNRALIDVHRIYTHFEKRTLEAAYQFYCEKNLDNAHSAEADTTATYEVFLAQLERYNTELKPDIQFLHDFSNEERFIDSGRRFIFSGGKAVFNFGKYKGRPVVDVLKTDPGYYSWIMQGDFAQHTKQKLTEIKERMKKA
ncbi:MAG: ribonuclease H-like domain-containing protein [Bacteroidetes bacterium]|nr:ribonuclease H-like domain-containing protein [Bacteroidota bacterium]